MSVPTGRREAPVGRRPKLQAGAPRSSKDTARLFEDATNGAAERPRNTRSSGSCVSSASKRLGELVNANRIHRAQADANDAVRFFKEECGHPYPFHPEQAVHEPLRGCRCLTVFGEHDLVDDSPDKAASKG